MKIRINTSWVHLVMIVVIAFMPLRVLTANADFSFNPSSSLTHNAELHDLSHEDCSMDSGCLTECQTGTTHCSSASSVIPSYAYDTLSAASYQPPVTSASYLRSISNRNLFRPPRFNA